VTKHAPVILQLSDTECGIAALAMVMAYFKINISLDELRDKCDVGRDGCSAKTLINIAREYGFEADAYRVELGTLAKLNHPVIAYWKFSHYVVINQLSGDRVCINDPAHGKVYLSHDELNHSFTGVILNIEPKELVKRSRRNPHKINIPIHIFDRIFILLCLLITSLTPYLYIILLNTCLQVNMSHLSILNHTLFLLLLLSMPILLLTTSLFSKLLVIRIIKYTTTLTHRKLVAHILHLPMSFFALRQRSEIISTLIRAEHANSHYVNLSFNQLNHAIIAIACTIGILLINHTLFICLSIITFFLLLIGKIIDNIMSKEEKSNTVHSTLYSYTQSSFQNIETIHMNGIHAYINDQWQKVFIKHLLMNNKVNLLKTWNSALIKAQPIIILIFICILITSANIHTLTLGEIGLIYMLQIILHSSIKNIIDCYMQRANLQDQFIRIAHINSRHIDQRFKQTNQLSPLSNSTRSIISCRNISFSYNQHTKEVLKNINLDIYPSEHIVITGHTATGKSTLAKLLCGLYPYHTGELLLFDKPISHYNATELATNCSYISQESDFIPGTLYENLTSFNDKIDTHTVVNIINMCQLDKLVARVGLHYKIETNRHTFSGGEKQRIELARALICNRPLLILDEALSALDDETVSSIINNLKKIDKTIIYITQHTQHLDYCNHVFELRNGELVTC